jgi:ABC-type molybdate transport system permease subunit
MVNRIVGLLLVLPLPVAIVWAYLAASGCQDECHGNVVYAGVCLLLTPPAAVGAVLLAQTSRDGGLTTLIVWLVGLVAILFAVGAIAALLVSSTHRAGALTG